MRGCPWAAQGQGFLGLCGPGGQNSEGPKEWLALTATFPGNRSFTQAFGAAGRQRPWMGDPPGLVCCGRWGKAHVPWEPRQPGAPLSLRCDSEKPGLPSGGYPRGGGS